MKTELWMKSNKTSNLDSNQKQNRNKVLFLLHKYWKKEEFPINSTHKERIPQIRDQRGTPCALAYILQNSGNQRLVDEIAQQNNYVYVDDVPDKHPLNYAIIENGFTKKEAAKIQPIYGNCHVLSNTAQVHEPIFEFLAIVLSIAGIGISFLVYRGMMHPNRKPLIIGGVFVMLMIGMGFFGFNQYSSAYSFPDYEGEMVTYSIGENHLMFYWVSNDQDIQISTNNDQSGPIININAKNDGKITIALPGIIRTLTYPQGDQIMENTDFFVLLNGEEINFEQTFVSKHNVLEIPLKEGTNEIEIIAAGMCRYILSEEKLNDYP